MIRGIDDLDSGEDGGEKGVGVTGDEVNEGAAGGLF